MEVQDRVLADFLPQMVWIVSASDRRLLYANTSFQTYIGASEQTWDRRSAHFHVDDLPLIDSAFDAVRREGHAPEQELRIRGKNGEFRWHKIMLVPVKLDDDIAEWIVTALDVDEMVLGRQTLQEATDLFSLSQEAAGAGTWDLDLRSGAVRLSRESARLHGVGDAAVEMDLDGWKKIVDPDDATMVLDSLQMAVDTRTTFNGEFRIHRADATVRWLSGIGRAYYDAEGDAIRMIGLNFDVTDRKTAEARLLSANAKAEDARREAERASLAKSDFLASMSHEIRTPLNSIIGYTDLLMEEVEHGSPLRRKLEIIQESGAALLTVVNDILDFSKIEAGQIELDPISFSPRALLDNVASMLAGQAHRKSISLTKHVSLNIPDFVIGDESRLRQILINLVNNAIKFTDEGRVAVNMSCERPPRSDEIEMIRFSIKDTGIGIAPEHQQRLFQRFSQVDGSINRRFGGSGLGLAICKQLVDLMGGEIGVESREGEGSTFWFRVPLALAAAPGAVHASQSERPFKSARILLVEDVEVNQELAKTVLERAGHFVDVASNGVEAVNAVQLKTYDVVLMDVHMPVMDGIAATQAIRAADHVSRSIPIVAMTANVLPQQIAGLKVAGMDDHVGKPFRRLELLAAVERWGDRTPVPETPAPLEPLAENRFDPERFSALEGMIGSLSFRRVVTAFSAHLASRFGDLGPSCDIARVVDDAHATINPAGLLGFSRLLAICRQFEGLNAKNKASPALLNELRAEQSLAITDLKQYLARSGET